jgi:hypothetical protein
LDIRFIRRGIELWLIGKERNEKRTGVGGGKIRGEKEGG